MILFTANNNTLYHNGEICAGISAYFCLISPNYEVDHWT